MRLIPNARRVLARAWSIRLALAIGALEALYGIWPYFNESVTPGTLAAVNIGLSLALVVARVIDQPGVQE